MKNKRRDFLKLTSAAGLGIATNIFNGFALANDSSIQKQIYGCNEQYA